MRGRWCVFVLVNTVYIAKFTSTLSPLLKVFCLRVSPQWLPSVFINMIQWMLRFARYYMTATAIFVCETKFSLCSNFEEIKIKSKQNFQNISHFKISVSTVQVIYLMHFFTDAVSHRRYICYWPRSHSNNLSQWGNLRSSRGCSSYSFNDPKISLYEPLVNNDFIIA